MTPVSPRAFRFRRHLHDPRVEPAERLDEIGLRCHDVMDVLVGVGRLVDSRDQELHAPFAEQAADGLPAVGLAGLRAAHPEAGAVARRVERGGDAPAADEKPGRGHRVWDDAEHPRPPSSHALARRLPWADRRPHRLRERHDSKLCPKGGRASACHAPGACRFLRPAPHSCLPPPATLI